MSIFEYDEEKEMGRIRRAERADGEKIGQARGEMLGAVNTIIILKELGHSKQETTTKITEKFNFEPEEAEKLVDENWC